MTDPPRRLPVHMLENRLRPPAAESSPPSCKRRPARARSRLGYRLAGRLVHGEEVVAEVLTDLELDPDHD